MRRPNVNARQSALLRDVAVGIAIAAAVFALLYANGGFAPTTRSYAGITAWWLLGAGAAVGIASARAGIDRLALAAVGLLAAFAVWILISVNWATDAERAFAQFNQVSLYVAVLAISIVLARLVPASWVVGGVALALASIAGVAFVSRCFPSTFGLQPGRELLAPLASRLSFPLGYWNGLGIEVALAYPLLLAIMTSRRSRVASAVGRVAAADPRRGHVPHLVTRRVRRRGGRDRRLRRAHPEALGGAGGAGRRGPRRRGRGRDARAQEGARQRTDGHRARRAPGAPRGALDRDRLRRDCARVARSRRARETAVDAAARRSGSQSSSRSSVSPSSPSSRRIR